MAVWMAVTVVPTSLGTVAMYTFMTELSRVIRNCPDARVSRTSPVPLAGASGARVLTARVSISSQPHLRSADARNAPPPVMERDPSHPAFRAAKPDGPSVEENLVPNPGPPCGSEHHPQGVNCRAVPKPSSQAAHTDTPGLRWPAPNGHAPGSDRRPTHLHGVDLGRWRDPAVGSNRPESCRGPTALANEAGVTEDGTHPATEVVPSPPGPSHVYSHRPCPGRALSIGRQRSFTDNKGRCVVPPSCRIAPYGAVRGSFPSSRFLQHRVGLLGN